MRLSPSLATGGSPTRQDLVDLRDTGCQVVINLALPTSPDALPDEGDFVRSLGLDYIAIPVVWENPTAQNLADFFAAMEANQERNLFVHCVKNMRVSAFIYLYRILRSGVAPEIARVDLARIWEPDGAWAAFIQNALRS